MSRYEEVIEVFNEKHDSPEVENITVGYSGIDPQRKSSGSGIPRGADGTGGGVFDGDDALGYGCRSGEGGRGLLILEYIEPLN